MRKFLQLACLTCTITFIAFSCNTKNGSSDKLVLKSYNDSLNYVLGSSYANFINNDMQSFGDDYNKDVFIKALVREIKGEKKLLKETEIEEFFNSYFEKQMKKQQGNQNMENTSKAVTPEESTAFLEANKKKESVVVLPSGLQYRVIKEGTGKKPKLEDTVEVHYEGRLIDGTVFDSSIERGEPAVFGVSQVIKGWVEALQLMPVGSKWELVIPSELAYGDRDAGPIPANSVLVFEVELLSIK